MANYTYLRNILSSLPRSSLHKQNHEVVFFYREKSIFDCMIANLFEEYRFFPKYPERQLKIASILFGEWVF